MISIFFKYFIRIEYSGVESYYPCEVMMISGDANDIDDDGTYDNDNDDDENYDYDYDYDYDDTHENDIQTN